MKCDDTTPSVIPNDNVNVRHVTPHIVPTTTDERIRLISKFNEANSTTYSASLTPSFIESVRLLILYHHDMRYFRLGNDQPYFIPCGDIFSINKRIYHQNGNKSQYYHVETKSIQRKLNRMVESPSRHKPVELHYT